MLHHAPRCQAAFLREFPDKAVLISAAQRRLLPQQAADVAQDQGDWPSLGKPAALGSAGKKAAAGVPPATQRGPGDGGSLHGGNVPATLADMPANAAAALIAELVSTC
jgi:hypothetical protein